MCLSRMQYRKTVFWSLLVRRKRADRIGVLDAMLLFTVDLVEKRHIFST